MAVRRVFIVLVVLLFGTLLRFHTYTEYPQRGATSDEYAFAFAGVSLLSTGIPTSWSAIPLYTNRQHLTIDRLYFPLVTPYLDHPPLFSLLVGAWAKLRGEQAFADITLATIRFVPITLSLLSLWLVYKIGERVYGDSVALWASLIYATTTLFVINSRVAVAESLITVLLLCAVYVCVSDKKISVQTVIGLGVLGGLSFLTKILGVVTTLAILYFLLTKKVSLRYLFSFLAVIALFAIGYALYGMWVGGDLFWRIQAYQGDRVVGPQTLWTLLTTPIIVNKTYETGWYYWSLVAVFTALGNHKKHIWIIIPTLLYLALLIFSVRQSDIHGWYYIPLFPLFSLLGASVLHEAISNMKWTVYAFVGMVVLSQFGMVYEYFFGLTTGVYRILGVIVLVPLLYAQYTGNKRRFALVAVWLFYGAIITNVLLTFTYQHPA